MNKRLRLILCFSLVVLLGLGVGFPAHAALQAVSPDPFITSPGGLNTGYPIWYQDFNNLKLELCSLENGLCLIEPPLDVFLGVGGETFWWTSEAAMVFPGGDGLLVLAMEAAFVGEDPVVGEQISFGRIRIRINVDTVGTYTVTHPFGQETFQVDAILPGLDINETVDIGCLAAPCDFSLALGSTIGPFLFWDVGLPVLDAGGVVGDNFYIGDSAAPHKVLGSPAGTNYFRIERDGVLVAETDLFVVSGKVFTGDGNTAPAAVNDSLSVVADTTVNFDVLANDTYLDIPINPGSIAFVQPASGTVTRAVVNGKVMAAYTPNAGFTGQDSFSYTVQNFGGAISAAATVSVVVEDLKVSGAVFRTNLMKFRIRGTSSDTTDNFIALVNGDPVQAATLGGAQEVPPVATAASGSATVTVSNDLTRLDFSLSQTGLINIAASHIHFGARGANGGVLFTLAPGDFASPFTGTLTEADFTPILGVVDTFQEALGAIISGEAYINIHTAGNAGGEIRGQLGPDRVIGEAAVQPDGSWILNGGILAAPADVIHAVSSNNVRVSVPLKKR